MDLTHLGRTSTITASPDEAQLDYVANPRPGRLYLVRFTIPEFTSLCPITGQPDFAHLVIDYAPGETIVESKSLKLFLAAFRNHQGFHEEVTVGIAERLVKEMAPQWLRIGGYWYPRGGIPIDVFWQSGEPPAGLWIPDQGVAPYRGRGLALAEAAPDLPHIVIHGAGSVGCYIGAAWLAAGLDVSFVGRTSVRDEIAANGLTVTDSERRRIEIRPDEVDFSVHPEALGRAGLIALCVKSNATAAAAKEIARHARRGATVISFQNGVSNGDVLAAALPGFTVLRGMVPFNVARMGNGRWHKGVAGGLWAEDHPFTRALAGRIGKIGGGLRLSSDMKGVLWGKLLINLNNAVNALSGRTLLEQLSDRDYRRVVAASQVEALEILAAAGIQAAQIGPIAPKLLPHVIASPDLLFRNTVLKMQKIDADARSSMADDFAAGRPTEIDWLNGEVVKLAHGLGRRAPVNERIVELVRQAEAGVERSWSAKELREHVLADREVAGFGY